MGQKYHQLSAFERNAVQHQLNLGRRPAEIAVALGRCRSTISREIRRNSTAVTTDCNLDRGYDAGPASKASLARRRRGLVRLAEGSQLRATVFEQIRLGPLSADCYAIACRSKGHRSKFPAD